MLWTLPFARPRSSSHQALSSSRIFCVRGGIRTDFIRFIDERKFATRLDVPSLFYLLVDQGRHRSRVLRAF